MVPVNSGFPHVKEFLLTLSVIWACALKNVCQLSSRLKRCKPVQGDHKSWASPGLYMHVHPLPNMHARTRGHMHTHPRAHAH